MDPVLQKSVKIELNELYKELTVDPQISAAFTALELNKAIKPLKLRKAADPDKIYPEFIKHLDPLARRWLTQFYSDLLNRGRVPQEFKMAQILAIVIPGKPSNDPTSYRPVAFLRRGRPSVEICSRVIRLEDTARRGV